MNNNTHQETLFCSRGPSFWDSLLEIGIQTTDAGPYAEDVFWLFRTTEGTLEVPGAWITDAEMKAMQNHLPDLSWEKVITAMGSTANRMYCLWQKRSCQNLRTRSNLKNRYVALIHSMGAGTAEARRLFEALYQKWNEPHRAYHNVEHLAECLSLLDDALLAGEDAAVAELALWYHDVIYDPRGSENETQSALRLQTDGRVLGLPAHILAKATACIMATAHVFPRQETDQLTNLVLDIDLAVLASGPIRFREYEDAVGEEYAHVPSFLFFLARGAFLRQLHKSPAIFLTSYFHETFEEKARSNVEILLNHSQQYAYHRWFGGLYRLWEKVWKS